MADVFTSHLTWSGAANGPTVDPKTFSRDLEVSPGGRQPLPMSAAPAYRGDPARTNPEELLVASVSACQALTYLFLAARAGIEVIAYSDEGEGRLGLVDGRMRMTHVRLRPRITLARPGDEARARALVDKAHSQCFIGNSLTSQVEIDPTFEFARSEALVG